MNAQAQKNTELNNTEQHTQALVALCKASADQLRLDILRVLSRDSFGVLELCNILDYKQSGLSHHLKLLATAGLLSTRREGNNIFYRRALHAIDSRLDDLQHSIFDAADQLSLSSDAEQRIIDLQTVRAQRSKDFFSRNADKFNEQQEQIAAYELYGNNTANLVARNANTAGNVLEVGPGEGAFLAELSPLFKTVYALDNSEQMLNKAKALAEQEQLSNIEFIHGDTKHSSLSQLKIDSIVVNMVLHHLPSPAEMFDDLGRLLAANGRLFITDLCSHDQHWAQDACGDLWLGFEPEELSSWAASAGLSEGQSSYLTQLNGFRVQIREFIKL
ncbi:MAG: ArsR family transcriptional regulator [Pseudohongiellaceae bacterium]|jgi:ArsR family transcriptional regulator